MSAAKRRVPVEDLAIGLYVSELDRPWLESPFLFQGFRIEAQADLDQLRASCLYVYVDPDRSDREAFQRLPSAKAAGKAAGESALGGAMTSGSANRRRELDSLFGHDAHPDPERFHRDLREAAQIRHQARNVVDDLLGQVQAGHTVDSRQARSVVQHLVRAITRNTTASLWLNNLKRRDEYTAIHCMNVCILALAFGRYLGMNRAELEILGLGALLHDIGKMRTPERVLNKPGPLSAEEFAVMRRHPVEGYEVMRHAGDVPAQALDIIRLHHERVSGRGYPEGLAGDDIPLAVRVVAIADVYDAMTSDRVYRRGVSADQAIRVMYNNAADDFGRELVEAFIRCVGIYPVGSLVELDNGALGIVISSLPQARLKPVLLLVRTPEGTDYQPRPLLNLAAMDTGDDAKIPVVRRVVDAAEHGIDVAALTEGFTGDST